MIPSEVSVLIIGGGGSGLTSSLFLSDLDVDSLLVERHPGTSHMPKAGAHNQRTMEIFRRHGIADEVQRTGAPAENRMRAAWMTTLGGNGPLDRRHLFSIDLNGEGVFREIYERDSPELSAGLGQYLIEPLIRRNAEKRDLGRLCFNHEVVSLEQNGSGAIAGIRDRATGTTHSVRAQYVIAADGGRSIGGMVGANLTGTTGLAAMLSIYFRADLSAYVDDDVMAYWFVGAEFGAWAGGSMVKAGPTKWDRFSETWTIHFMFHPDDPDIGRLTKNNALPRLRKILNLPELDAEVLGVSPWTIEAVQTDQYRVGNIFFIGDAAHRQPPTSGLGLQSAIQDADNLAWKLAAVLHGWAPESLLDTYESERRAVIAANVEYALFAFQNQFAFEAGLGLNRAKTTEERRAAFLAYFADTPIGETRRARAREVFNTVRLELNPHDREIGFHYGAGALIPDGTVPPPRDPMGVNYIPTTRPGHRLPHAWLNKRGQRVSTHDIGGIGKFILLTGRRGASWCEAADELSRKTLVPISAFRISADGDFGDPTRRWERLREIEEDGALLIRPDRYVACRFPRMSEDPYDSLRSAMSKILGRSFDDVPSDLPTAGSRQEVEFPQ
ncbi:MAG: aromatic ring hydroxylase [Mesorhizobium sp.]|uniref:FAD-dependent monooxygenase n=1 Tax=Mesorhizobium sp. TaxID=1871066 RepID=UPI000FE5B020|nr:FAD-dependent monooxygenase [Mesorhizobium sp.]RWI57082.1 MAG: aromatic ring hydroxylase [Mesorhizobium sp.]